MGINIKTHIEIEVSVYADHQPYEPETLETPAVEEAIEHMSVHRGAYDITKQLTKDQLSNIESLLWEEVQESKLLTDTHLPDLDENLAKLSITL
jgi:hypothetical protein